MNPLDWPAGPFLQFYLLLCLGAFLIVFLLWQFVRGSANPLATSELDFLELAYLSGGVQRMADTVMVALMAAGGATYQAKQRLFSFNPTETPLPRELMPIHAQLDGSKSRKGIRDVLRPSLEKTRDRLVRRGLVLPPERQRLLKWGGLGLIAILLFFGIAKIAVGLSRHRPVGFLAALVFMELIIGLLWVRRPLVATAAGEMALWDNRLRYARLARAPLGSELALAFAITGAAVLVGTPFAAFGQTVRSDYGSGCGGGGGGCGGGGDGGGCGGCGGH